MRYRSGVQRGGRKSCESVRRAISDAEGRSLRRKRVRVHLSRCPGCAAFASSIPRRRGDLHALVPLLPGEAAAALFARAVATGGDHSFAPASGALVRAGNRVGAVLAVKALAGVALVAAAGAAVTTMVAHHARSPAPLVAPVTSRSAAGHRVAGAGTLEQSVAALRLAVAAVAAEAARAGLLERRPRAARPRSASRARGGSPGPLIAVRGAPQHPDRGVGAGGRGSPQAKRSGRRGQWAREEGRTPPGQAPRRTPRHRSRVAVSSAPVASSADLGSALVAGRVCQVRSAAACRRAR
jgi:hypothetical protein